ncbi:MAG TPA: hypothetical protein VJ725_28160 [Thermoanaerobaculia bacterium]|nr:hypothetical protein [Thermoanaerobaculia bacterium]
MAWTSMAALLEDLERIGDVHPEIYDTDVRERMGEVVNRVLIRQSGDVQVPEDLGMFSAEGNRALRECLEQNLRNLKAVFEVFSLDTEAKRQRSFFNPRLRTERGAHVEEFFGHP